MCNEEETMSWLHLLWIVPLAFALGAIFSGLLAAGSRAEEWYEMDRRREESENAKEPSRCASGYN
jgi:hypothetical protein